MYRVKFYLRLFWFFIPIRTAGVFNFNQLQEFLQGYYNIKSMKYETVKSFVGRTVIISGWKKYSFGMRMRVVRI